MEKLRVNFRSIFVALTPVLQRKLGVSVGIFTFVNGYLKTCFPENSHVIKIKSYILSKNLRIFKPTLVSSKEFFL